MSAPKLKKCRGLYTASNRYDVPEGALVQATNILILKDGVIQPRWSLAQNANSMVTGNVSHWHRGAELNGTLWYGGRDTSANTLKIGYASPTFTGVTVAQTEDGPDLYTNFTGTSTPWFDVEFVKLGNLLYYNCFRGLVRIESTSVQRLAGNYPCAVSCFPRPISTSLARSGTTTVTATTAISHGFVPGLLVKMTSAGNGDFGAGEFTIVTVPTGTTFTYVDATATTTTTLASQVFSVEQFVGSSGFMAANDQVAYRAMLVEFDTNGNAYEGEVSGRVVVENASPYLGNAANKNVQLAVLFPPTKLAANTKVELYRSRTSPSAEPNDEMGLVYSKFLNADDVARGYTWITDINPDGQLDKALYTNETQAGFVQNNVRPAGAKTIAVWGKRLVQANTYDFPQIKMQLKSVDSGSGGLVAGDYLYIDQTSQADTTFFLATASSSAFTTTTQYSIFTGGTASSDVRHTVLSLVDSINWRGSNVGVTAISPMTTSHALYTSLPDEWPGHFTIRLTGASQYPFATGGDGLEARFINFDGAANHRDAFSPKLGTITTTTPIAADTSRTSNITTVTTTAAHFYEVGEYVQLYTFGATYPLTPATIGGTTIEGVILTVPSSTTFTISNTGSNGNSAAVIKYVYLKYGPRLLSNPSVNTVRASKIGQQEGFPAFGTVKVGANNAKILKCVACKDSLMVFKEDGLFRVTATGEFGENLAAELVDPNAILWAKDTAVAINGVVMAWLTRGVAVINEQGVIKYCSANRIEDKLKPAQTNGNLEPYQLQAYPYTRRAQAFVDEQNGLYELRICMATSPSAPYASTVNLTYNILNDTWVEDDLAVVSEILYTGLRYIQTGTTFQAQQSAGARGGAALTTQVTGFSSYSASAQTVAFTYSGAAPSVGATVQNLDAFELYYVLSAAAGSGVLYCPSRTTIPSVPVVQNFYNPVVSTIEYSPITFSEENKLKLHREIQTLFGVSETMVVETVTYSDLVTTTETVVNKMGSVSATASVGVDGYLPETKRFAIPQQHRVAQQLNFRMVIRCAFGAWTILGVGCDGKLIGAKVSR